MSFSKVMNLIPSLRSSLPPILIRNSTRSYATKPPLSFVENQKVLQERQLRLAEKAGRMKQNIGVLTTIPVFANYVRPRSTRQTHPGLTWGGRWMYFKSDWGNDIYTLYLRYQLKKALGKGWLTHFTSRAEASYLAANAAFSTGNYTSITPLASTELVSDIKGRRSGSFQGLRLNWKLHGKVLQDIVCVRQQEVQKVGEFVAQVAVRFNSEQSLEVSNSAGTVISGSHAKPTKVTEYYVFQRNLWEANADWKAVKKINENDPFDGDRSLFKEP